MTRVIHAGILSILSPPGIMKEIFNLLLCVIAGTPACAGSTISQTPKSFLVKGCDSLFQPLKSPMRYARSALGAHSRYVMSPLSEKVKPNFS